MSSLRHLRMALLVAVLVLAAACATGDGVTAQPGGTGEDPLPSTDPGTNPEPEDSDPGSEPGTDTRPGAGLTAVATVFPLAWMASRIAPAAEHTHLVAQGQDPHDLELSPGERALIESADVLVYMGELGFQPQVETAATGRDGATVDVRAIAGDGVLLDFHGDDDNGQDDDHSQDDDHGQDDDALRRESYDPHLWFDAGLMADVALALGDAFAEADPAGAEAYRSSAQDLHAELLALAAELDALLSDCRHGTAIVSHEAYGYLLAHHGLHQEGISDAGGHVEASPQRLAELTLRIRDEGIPAVLAEPAEGRADAEALAREAGVDLLEIDPLETADEEAFETGYPELLRRQAEQFARALDCG